MHFIRIVQPPAGTMRFTARRAVFCVPPRTDKSGVYGGRVALYVSGEPFTATVVVKEPGDGPHELVYKSLAAVVPPGDPITPEPVPDDEVPL